MWNWNIWDTKHLWTDKLRKGIADIQPHVPDFDIEWTTKAVLCHFAVGVILGWVIAMAFMKRVAPPERSGDTTWLARLYDWLSGKLYKVFPRSMNVYAACMALWCGLISWLPDVDHLLTMPLGHPSGRVLHPVFFIFGIFIVWYSYRRIRKLKSVNADEKKLRPCIAGLATGTAFIAHVAEDFMLSWW